MKALLVYPECPDSFWKYPEALKYVGRKAAFAPLGLLTVAAMFPASWELKVVDLNIEPLTDAHIEWANVIFVSAMHIQLHSANEVIVRCSAKGKKVVGGGPAFTSSPEKFPLADHILHGEAENIFPFLISDLESDSARKIYKSGDYPDLADSPIPRWDLVDIHKYGTMSIQYCRGCPFDCEFCDVVALFGRKIRKKRRGQIITELELLYRLGWRGSVFFVDDNFIGNIPAAKMLLEDIIEWQKSRKYPFKFLTQASINLAQHEDLLHLMEKANFHEVFVGIETTNREALKAWGKNQNVAIDLAEAVRTIQRSGIKVMAGFIVGSDWDTPETFRDIANFIMETGITVAMVGILIALPGTRLWKRLKAENRLIEDFDQWDNTRSVTNFIPIMGMKALVTGYPKLVRYLYRAENYYKRIEKLFETYRPAKKSIIIPPRDKQAFLKSLWRIGILSKNRGLYWKLLWQTLRKKETRSLFPDAVAQAILAENFKWFSLKLAG